MRARFWLTGLLLAGLFVAWEPAPARAAIWPFSYIWPEKPPVKRPRPKPGRPRPGAQSIPAWAK
jgi:hypothetical protein